MEHYRYWVLVYLWFTVQIINSLNENILYISGKGDNGLTNVFWIVSSLPAQHMRHAAISDAYSKPTLKHFFSLTHVQGPQIEGHAYLCNDKKLCDFMCNLQAWNGNLMYYVIFWKFKMLVFLLTLVTGDFVFNFKIAQFELSSRQTHFVLQQWKQLMSL